MLRFVIQAGFVIAFGCCRIEASTLVLDLVLGPPVHDYSPEWSIQIPSSGTILTQPAASIDQAASADAVGMVISLNGVTMIRYNLLAPDGSFFHVSSNAISYTLGYSISLGGWDLPADKGSGATATFLGVTGTPPPWFFNNITNDSGASVLNGFSEASSSSYTFTGMRVTMPVINPPTNGPTVLNFAKISLSSRDLYGTVDPGQAMNLIIITEHGNLLSVIISGLLLLRRNRSTH